MVVDLGAAGPTNSDAQIDLQQYWEKEALQNQTGLESRQSHPCLESARLHAPGTLAALLLSSVCSPKPQHAVVQHRALCSWEGECLRAAVLPLLCTGTCSGRKIPAALRAQAEALVSLALFSQAGGGTRSSALGTSTRTGQAFYCPLHIKPRHQQPQSGSTEKQGLSFPLVVC